MSKSSCFVQRMMRFLLIAPREDSRILNKVFYFSELYRCTVSLWC